MARNRNTKSKKSYANPRASQKPLYDPGVQELVQLIQEEGLGVDDLYNNSYLSRSTIQRMVREITKKPMGLTLRGIAEAAGYSMVFKKKERKKR